MTDVKFDFDGDPDKLIEALRQIKAEERAEAAERRKIERESREMAKAEQLRLRDQIRAGKESKRVVTELGRAAEAAMGKAKDPMDAYTKALYVQQQALDAGAISIDTFRQRKFELLRTLREAKAAQNGENEELREAAQLVRRAETDTQKYDRRIKSLNMALRRGKISQDQYNAGMRQAGVEMRQAGTATDDWSTTLGSTIGQMVGITSATGAAVLVIAQLRAEYDRLIERQNAARDTTVTLAEAQEQALANLGDDPMNGTQLFNRIRSESQNLGMDETVLTKAVSDALSARSDLPAEKAIEAVVASARQRRFAPEELPVLSGAAIDINKMTGKSMEESLGFLMDVGSQSRVTSLKSLATNVAPAILGGKQFGVSEEFAGATAAAMSQGMVDTEGATSGTATIQLLKQLRAFRPGQNVEQTFQQMVGSDEMKKEFFASPKEGGFGASFEAKALPAIEGLLTQGAKVNQQFTSALDTLLKSDSQKRFDTAVAQKEALPAVQIAMEDQRIRNLNQQLQLADESGARSGAVREGLQNIRDTLGRTGIGSKFDSLFEDAITGGSQDMGTLRDALEAERKILLQQQRSRGGGFLDFISAPFTIGSNLAQAGISGASSGGTVLSSADVKQAELLQTMIDRLNEIKQAQEHQNKIQQAGQLANQANNRLKNREQNGGG